LKPQDIASQKLAQAQKRITFWSRKVVHASNNLAAWQRKAAHFARRSQMTDEQIEAERVKRSTRKPKLVRALNLKEE
jgi:hypothetical protein